jgi:hypothetical protein
LKFDTSRADGQFRKPASNKKLLNIMGAFRFTPFEQGKDPDSPLSALSLILVSSP